MDNNSQTIIIVVGTICLALIEIVALMNNVNGTMLSVVVGGITAIIGYGFGIFKRTKETVTDTEKV